MVQEHPRVPRVSRVLVVGALLGGSLAVLGSPVNAKEAKPAVTVVARGLDNRLFHHSLIPLSSLSHQETLACDLWPGVGAVCKVGAKP
jgi:hypothetical protein